MLHKTLCTILISVTCLANINSQNDLTKFTYSITNKFNSEYDKTKDIYFWVCSNIKFDIKKYARSDASYLSLSELLKQKKGVSSDFSKIITALCQSVGIEAYTIRGYYKNSYYYPEHPFLRSNHSWNVVQTDSKWIILDATLGSGFISHLSAFGNKLAFIPGVSLEYFDIPFERVANSHYPLDPKWLFSRNPISYTSFASNRVISESISIDYESNIEEVRNTNEENQLKIEGINSLQHNPLNSFDVAWGYLENFKNYELSEEINEENLPLFEEYLNEYTLILAQIIKYKNTADSMNRLRTKSLHALAIKHNNLVNTIKSKTLTSKNSQKIKQEQIARKNSSYDKKIFGFAANMGRSEFKRLKEQETQGTINHNNKGTDILNDSIDKLTLVELKHEESLDSLKQIILTNLAFDASRNDSLFSKNYMFNKAIFLLNQVILAGDETNIRKNIDSLERIFLDIEGLLENKKRSKKFLEETANKYYSIAHQLQQTLKLQTSLLKKLYKGSNYSVHIFSQHNETTDRLIKSYNLSIGLTQKLAIHNQFQKDIRKQNYKSLKSQNKHIVRNQKIFTDWHNFVLEQELNAKNIDKIRIRYTRSKAIKGLKFIEPRINKYKKAHPISGNS